MFFLCRQLQSIFGDILCGHQGNTTGRDQRLHPLIDPPLRGKGLFCMCLLMDVKSMHIRYLFLDCFLFIGGKESEFLFDWFDDVWYA